MRGRCEDRAVGPGLKASFQSSQNFDSPPRIIANHPCTGFPENQADSLLLPIQCTAACLSSGAEKPGWGKYVFPRVRDIPRRNNWRAARSGRSACRVESYVRIGSPIARGGGGRALRTLKANKIGVSLLMRCRGRRSSHSQTICFCFPPPPMLCNKERVQNGIIGYSMRSS